MRWIVLLSVCLAGCGAHVEEQIKPYYARFQARYHTDPYEIEARFGTPHGTSTAECIRNTHRNRIILDKAAWDNTTDAYREALVFHELGHCVWNLPHIDAMVLYKGFLLPGSIMYGWDITDAYYYAELREKYLEALPFNRPISIAHP